MPSWFRIATPLYKNTGSVARDHLAAERTFLAWIRTGLGFVALGIAMERFSQLDLGELIPTAHHHEHENPKVQKQLQRERALEKEQDKENSHVQVGVLMALGAGSILFGTGRYFSNMRYLERGKFKPAYHGAAVMAAAVAGLAGGVYGSALRRRRAERADIREGSGPRN
ncbi:hypothetical protein F5Y19DRAFT_458885 [Xylariaceae sp. FL1651]|nr:hypothetical protein F5Y19DRAFT_458885 [Xylariaceae sp. FL1651]